MERILINAGKSQGLFPGTLMDLINRNIEGKKPDIGRIELRNDYSLFDVDKKEAGKVISSLNGLDFFGTRLRLEKAGDRDFEKTARNRRAKSERKAAAKKSARASESSKSKKGKKVKKGYIGTPANDVITTKPAYNGNYDIFMKKKN